MELSVAQGVGECIQRLTIRCLAAVAASAATTPALHREHDTILSVLETGLRTCGVGRGFRAEEAWAARHRIRLGGLGGMTLSECRTV